MHSKLDTRPADKYLPNCSQIHPLSATTYR